MQIAGSVSMEGAAAPSGARSKSRNLLAACLAHALHDGYTDSLYVFLPVWQAQFGLSYVGLAVIRALYSATMGGLQLPGNKLLRPFSPRRALVLSTFVATGGFLIMALSTGFVGLCVGLVIAGTGSSIQHPRGSLLVTDTYGGAMRKPLGVYNFSGDLGKAAFPAGAAILLPIIAWRPVAGMMALLGLIIAMCLFTLAPTGPVTERGKTESRIVDQTRSGFGLLTAIGALDAATRVGYLLFLPFLIHGLGGTSATIGLGIASLLVGGALGKATCSWLSQQLGVVGSVLLTETATAFLITATLFTSLIPVLIILPLLGVVLNGTSSVLYGTVPELAPEGDTGRGFAIFYTFVTGSGGLAPIIYGAIADHLGQTAGILAAAATAALIIPLAITLRPFLGPASGHETASASS